MDFKYFKSMRILTKNYVLKKISISDVNKNYLKWFSDKKIKKYIDSSPKTIQSLQSYVKEANANPNTFFWAIFKNQKHIGNIKIFEINYKKKIGRLGILIGDKKYRNKGIGNEIIEATKKFLIKKNILELWLGVEKNNFAAINSYKKSGFVKFRSNKKYIYMKCDLITSKIIIGGAQLNSNYGITNFRNKTQSKSETNKIINILRIKNLMHIDGAECYKFFRNDQINILKNFKIDSKIFLEEISNYKKLKIFFTKKYLHKNIKIETLFIHDGDNIFKNSYKKKLMILKKLKKEKIISKIGISIYNFEILNKIISKLNVDVVQLPYNLVDRRIENFKNIISKSKIQIYARSIFLQGSLLKKVKEIKNLATIYEKVRKFTKKTNQSNLDLSLNFVLNNDLVDKIIVGVRNSQEINKLINYRFVRKKIKIKFTKNEKKFAHNPSKWK